jgi:large subunit ribosomal protein L10
MKSQLQKKESLKKLKDKISKAKITIFTSFSRAGERGLSVAEIRELRKRLINSDSEYLVEKKTLIDKSLKEAKKKDVDVFSLDGSLGITFGYGEETATAKSIYDFAKKHPALKYFSAVWGDKFMDFAQLTEFAKLPTKDVMIARLLAMMKYPLSGLAMVLKQVADKKATNN